MRRRKKALEVSTFPFLAVLLCTMGSLILVLLVMDRKAKLAARQKAERTTAQVVEEHNRVIEERRAALARQRADREASVRAVWDAKRKALDQHLTAEEAEL